MLYRKIFLCCLLWGLVGPDTSFAQAPGAQWIGWTAAEKSPRNTWLAFRQSVNLAQVPNSLFVQIACDTKYWLWINGKAVVLEGGLKRGPNPRDTYVDSVNLAPHLRVGNNVLAYQVAHFGKSGYSHLSSERAGLWVQAPAAFPAFNTSSVWEVKPLEAFQLAGDQPNSRLSEPSLRYDARLALDHWTTDLSIPFSPVQTFGPMGYGPWNQLVPRPIPLFHFGALQSYRDSVVRREKNHTRYAMRVGKNQQLLPCLKIRASQAGLSILVTTNNNALNAEPILSMQYLTKSGVQDFEFPLWINGEEVYYDVPPGVEVLALTYRPTSYATQVIGQFSSSDVFLEKLWQKSITTLLVNMRDNWMDCPDRERAGWAGDAVFQSLQAGFVLDQAGWQLNKKWYQELLGFVGPESGFFSIIPKGWTQLEIPNQTLVVISAWGIENHWQQTQDTALVKALYPHFKKYLAQWPKDAQGLVQLRKGDAIWNWGDWGGPVDEWALTNLLYLGSLKTMSRLAATLEGTLAQKEFELAYQNLRQAIRRSFWRGRFFAAEGFVGQPDERVQAFAILHGAATASEWPALVEAILNRQSASPYMEQFVFEALCQAGYPEAALFRFKQRYAEMVNHASTTLWEGWRMPNENGQPKGPNHGWSGAALYLFPKWIHGFQSQGPGFSTFQLQPFYGRTTSSQLVFPSVHGMFSSRFSREKNTINHQIEIPSTISGQWRLERSFHSIEYNGIVLKVQGQLTPAGQSLLLTASDSLYYLLPLSGGQHAVKLVLSNSAYQALLNSTIVPSANNQLLFFPNPVVSHLVLPVNRGRKTAQIFSLDGRLVLRQTIADGQNTLALGQLTKGTYVLVLETENGNLQTRGRFIKL